VFDRNQQQYAIVFTLFLTSKNDTFFCLLLDVSLNISTSYIISIPSAFKVILELTRRCVNYLLLTHATSGNDRRPIVHGLREAWEERTTVILSAKNFIVRLLYKETYWYASRLSHNFISFIPFFVKFSISSHLRSGILLYFTIKIGLNWTYFTDREESEISVQSTCEWAA